MSIYDLRTCSYDEFLDFVFDHPVEKEHWYWDSNLKVAYDTVHNTELLTKLFSNAKPLLGRYTREQLEQGFWALQSGCVDGLVEHAMSDLSVPFEKRAECIRAMFLLYRDLFAFDALETSSNMWWDSISSFYEFSFHRSKKVSDDDKKIQDVMFETLTKILHLDSEECQGAALHGLGHLHHPNTEKVIRDWIATQSDLPEDDLEFAEACITGDIM